MNKTRLPILDAIHETAKGLHKAGVMDQVTLLEFDRLAVPSLAPLRAELTRKIREGSDASQAVFARLLNTSLSMAEVGSRRRQASGGRGT